MADRHIDTFVPANDDHELFREERHNFVPCTTVNIGDEPQLIRLHNLITSCCDSCREISLMLAVAGDSVIPTTERKRGLVRREAIQVVKQRLLLWSATISEYKDLSLLIPVPHAIQTLARIKSVLYDISETCRHGIQTLGRDSYSEQFTKDLLPLVGSLYSNLPGTWRDTIEWALTATLIKTTASTMIKEKIKLNDNDRIFIESLGSPKIEQNFIYMLDLIDENKDTSPAPLLTPDNLVPSGSYDGIGVYSQKSDIDGPLMGGLISIRTEWTMDQVRTDLGDIAYIRTKYQQRLRLPKPDEMRVLVLGGYSENSTTGRVELLYRFPYWASQRSPPVSLRRLIAEKQLPDDIEVRFSIARKLICAILYFHACRWIHGNIDDRNIIFFEDSEHNLNFEEPFFCEFIPSSKDGLKAIPTTKESADVIFGDDVKLRNADTKRLWRTVLLVIFEKETVAPNGSPDSCLGYVGSFHDPSKWAEIDDCVYVPDWSSDKGVGRSTLEGNLGINDDYISSQGMYSKLTRILNLCSPMPTKYSRDCNIRRTYTGTWPAIPHLGLEGYEKAQYLKAAEPREDKEGTDKQSKSMGGLSDTDIGLPGELEKQEIRSEVFPVMATQEQITQWQKEILPRLERILEKHLPAEESVSIDLLGIGTSRDKSRPTIVVTCKSSRSVKLHLKRFPYDRTVFGLKVRKGSVQRSSGGSGRIAAQYSRHQEKPLPGASIGACLDGNPLPAATYGGLILVDNKPYGLTVHHLVDPDEQTDGGGTDVEEGQLTSARGPHRHGEIVNRCLYSESEASTSDVEFEPDDEQGSMWGSLVGEADDEIFNDTEIQDISEPNGDIPGLGMNHNKRIVVVQPAAMDLLDQERSECESVTKDYYLGTILASSGIKRVIFESEKHEIDWALIEISSDRLGQRNLIQGGGRFLISHTYTYDEDSEPCYYVSTNEFSNLAVHGIGRTSGLKEGRISGAISAIRIHGRKTFSRSWGVTGEIGVGGDSGAWVIDNRRGGVCGHIIASKNDDDDKVKIAYIIPMELLLRDIKKTLQAESVCLPTAAVAAQIGYMVESRLTECEGSSAADIRPINPTLSTGGSDDVSSLASLPSS